MSEVMLALCQQSVNAHPDAWSEHDLNLLTRKSYCYFAVHVDVSWKDSFKYNSEIIVSRNARLKDVNKT